MNVLLGLSASNGIGIGTAFVVPESEKRVISSKKIKAEDKPQQLERFDRSLAKVTGQIASQLDAVKGDKVQSEIFETYFLMLNDPEFLGDVRKTFEASEYSIEYVLNQKTEEYANKLRSSGNAYLAERAEDICDIFGRVLNDLLDFHPFDIENVPDGAVIVAKSMNPSDTVILSKRQIAGIALTDGGVSSHVGETTAFRQSSTSKIFSQKSHMARFSLLTARRARLSFSRMMPHSMTISQKSKKQKNMPKNSRFSATSPQKARTASHSSFWRTSARLMKRASLWKKARTESACSARNFCL